MVKRLLFSLTLVLAAQPVLDACTTFCVRAGIEVLFGRNYDFEIGDGMVMVNPAGADKKGYLEGGPSWHSKYGSVTFNQFGRGLPMGGLNQAGVVVELMWLDETQYPARDARSPLSVLEWIQYQLDTAASVADVLASDGRVRIQGRTPLHYLVSDRTGATATIEFLEGKLVSHKGADLPFTALANDSYAKSRSFVEGRGRKPAGGSGSLERFSRAALALPAVASAGSTKSSPEGSAAVDRAFAVLADVGQRSTRWSIVYQQSTGIVHWRTDRHPARRFLRMADVSFDCGADAVAIDVHAPLAGNARPRMVPLTAAMNHALVAGSTKKTSFTRATPDAEIAADARYGVSAVCVGGTH